MCPAFKPLLPAVQHDRHYIIGLLTRETFPSFRSNLGVTAHLSALWILMVRHYNEVIEAVGYGRLVTLCLRMHPISHSLSRSRIPRSRSFASAPDARSVQRPMNISLGYFTSYPAETQTHSAEHQRVVDDPQDSHHISERKNHNTAQDNHMTIFRRG